jgi:hypothetical protein
MFGDGRSCELNLGYDHAGAIKNSCAELYCAREGSRFKKFRQFRNALLAKGANLEQDCAPLRLRAKFATATPTFPKLLRHIVNRSKLDPRMGEASK